MNNVEIDIVLPFKKMGGIPDFIACIAKNIIVPGSVDLYTGWE